MESSENETKPPPGFERVTSDNHKVVISPFIFLTSKVSFTDQKLGYRVIVITVICSRTSGAFVNVHIATSLKIYTCVKSIKFARDAMLNDGICLETVIKR